MKHYVATALVLLAASSATLRAAEKPNVLFIAVDDLNDWIGCMDGHPAAFTPNIDRLAKRGALFTNAHCAAPACNPSRAAVFSGKMPQTTGVWANQAGQSLKRNAPKALLLPQALAKAGYQTLGTGKLLHGGGTYPFDEYHTVSQRWSPLTKEEVQYAKDELPSKASDNPRHVIKDHFGQTIVLPLNRLPSDRKPKSPAGESFDWGPFETPESKFGDTQITDWAIKQLEKRREKPLFLAVGYYRPHIPLWAPKRFFGRFTSQPAELPKVLHNDLDDLSPIARKWALEPITAGSHSTVLKHDQWKAAVEAYLACVSYIDHEVGRLIDAVDSNPELNNTIIVLWSDHGWHLGEKQHWGKWTGWERATKVPLIIVPSRKMNGQFAKRARCNQPVSLIDLYPTLLDLCDVQGPSELDGRSLTPLMKAPHKSTDRAVITMFDRGNASLRTERWRFIRYADASEEMYDHEHDPHEWRNLASDPEHGRVRSALRRRLNDALAKITPE